MAEYTPAVETARTYYNSTDADIFYHTVWGGEDIHIGLYEHERESVFAASRRTVETMAKKLNGIGPKARILDLGAGYGGAARFLAQNRECNVCALNLSEVENQRNRDTCCEMGVDALVEVIDGSFEKVPYPDRSFDAVWSQDAILHSGQREAVIAETARVLKSGGDFIFTDPMAADACPEGVLAPILDRIHLETLGSPGFYRAAAKKAGMAEVSFEDHAPQLINHYTRILEETENNESALIDAGVSAEYIRRMKKGLRHWIEGGKNGYLAWGIFHFKKA